jgi:hypothetical protein
MEKKVMLAGLTSLTHLCALHLSIPDREIGRFSMTMEEIATFLASFQNLVEVDLIMPKPSPNSASTTPRTLMDLSERKKEQRQPTTVFKNVFGQNIYGKVKWSAPKSSYY